ncbi:hypothetical protein [Pseudomonas vranovensis]|uniref:hypothetical protein n=1 Tax=Pseudomonas vranovensis TaxID=321661 RepID=UPI000413FD0B|nr:hypothetical protein [Pseudomonas vranovensis]
MIKNNIWYLAGPFHQYRENVKALAQEHGLRIVDANAAQSREGEAEDVPEVTIRPELKAVVVAPGIGHQDMEYLRSQLGAIEELAVSLESGVLDVPRGDGVALRIHESVVALHKDLEAQSDQLVLVRKIVESFAAQSLERPEGELGETTDHLLKVLEAVNAGIASLQRERDGEVEKAQDLQRKLDEFVAQTAQGRQVPDEEREAKEVAELKARLDAASVSYRANASKESLQKLIDDLSKA